MKKLINGQDALIALANGSDVQCLHNGQWQSALTCTAVGFLKNAFEFRIAPKMIKIGNVEIEAPETEAPPASGRYYIPNLADIRLYREVYWHNTNYNQANLKYGVIHLSPENAEAHAKALILASGGSLDEVVPTEPAATEPAPTGPVPDPEDPLADMNMDEPTPVMEDENPPAPEKKPRQRKKQNSVEPVADIAPAEPTNDTAEFVTPPAVEFEEPQPADLDSDAVTEQPASSTELSRVDKLVGQITNAKTVGEVTTIFTRYTIGLSAADYKIVSDAIVNRHKELADSEPEPPSLAEHIKASQTIPELSALVPEIMGLDIQVMSSMETIYNQRRAELLKAKDGE
ncbi:MAG: hypothetical protein EOO69_04655 [Moraxellaceae bacterium]|nr:MAG: hypothetical protein EOO69_04655 [Moraxellaceae bacterium]